MMRCTTLMIILICVLNTVKQTYSADSGIIYYHEKIAHSVGTRFQNDVNVPPSKKVIIKYHITFKEDKCCPIILFGVKRQLIGKYYSIACFPERYYLIALYSPFYVYTNREFPFTNCQILSDNYVCNGTIILVSDIPRHRYLDIAYQCQDEKNLNLTLSFEMQYFTDFLSPCEPIEIEHCKDFGYNYTTFPNVIGQPSQKHANDLLVLTLKALAYTNCYQHLRLLACNTLFPKCDNGKVIYPCYEMCTEAFKGCAAVFQTYGQPFHCNGLSYLGDPDECIYEPVRCPPLDPPRFGTVVTNGHNMLFNETKYSCNSGYELQGKNIRHCTYSGFWNGSAPVCLKVSNVTSPAERYGNKRLLAMVIPLSFLSFFVITAALCFYCRENIKLLFLHNVRIEARMQANLPQKKKLFITYSSQDMNEVNQEFLPLLRQQLLTWDALTYQEDFVPGHSLLTSIHKCVWESQAMLVLLTENYIASNMCRYEFAEAETRTVTDKTFRLIVILFVKNDQNGPIHLIDNLPEDMRKFVRSRVYLSIGENLFWNKLRRALAKNV